MLLKTLWFQYAVIATHNQIMNIHKSIIDIHNSTYGYAINAIMYPYSSKIMDIHNSYEGIYNWIIDVLN